MTEDEREKLEAIYDFFFKPLVPGGKITRAQQMEDLLNLTKSSKLVARLTLWIAGAIVAIGAAIATLKGWNK